MGISGPFWECLKSSECSVTGRSEVCGKWVAVDLSGWLVEAEKSPTLSVLHSNPHLYLVFHRVVQLLRLNCRVIAVVDGVAPTGKKKRVRNHLDEKSAEASSLLEALGVPVVVGSGEGEGTAAALNALGLVDAVATADGDAFLYGAKIVYRDMTSESLTSQARILRKYQPSQHEVFGLNDDTHRNLVAFALLVGTDIHHESVPGIGIEKALTFVKHCSLSRKIDALSVLEAWRDDRPDLKNFKSHFLAGASKETQTICTSIWRHFAQSGDAFPDKDLVKLYVEPNLPAKLRKARMRPDLKLPSAKALYFVNAASVVIGHDVATSWGQMQKALTAPPPQRGDDDLKSCEQERFEVFVDDDFPYFSHASATDRSIDAAQKKKMRVFNENNSRASEDECAAANSLCNLPERTSCYSSGAATSRVSPIAVSFF